MFLLKLLNFDFVLFNIIYCYFKISLLVSIISAEFNFTLTITLIIREKKNPEFNEWFKKNGLTAEVITSLSIADVEILSFLNSNFAGSPRFAAHFSEDTEEWLSAASWVNLFIQDISQFAIQVIIFVIRKKR